MEEKYGIRLDVGCGEKCEPGWVGLDRRDLPGVHFVHDVEEFPWPLPDNSCSVVKMVHLYEHIKPWLSLDIMNELWRVLHVDGQLQLTTPYGMSHGFVQDPTHCNPSNEHTWEYLDPAYKLYGVFKPKPWHIFLYENQLDGNQLVVLSPRKEEDAKPTKIEIVEKRKHKDIAVSLTPADIAKAYHIITYEQRSADQVPGVLPKWMGYHIDKTPDDLWRYQELIAAIKPGLIIELGSANGASALFFAHMLDLVKTQKKDFGRVVTVDVDSGQEPMEINPSRTNPGKRPKHPRIKQIIGSSVDIMTAKRIGEFTRIKQMKPVMVILDSDHSCDHVMRELDIYAPLVSVGSALVVEDTNINGHPVYPEYGPGPREALLRWLPRHPEFEVDKKTEDRSYLTFHPGGWLRRVK